MRVIGVIPARLGSTRFPAKVLALLGGKPLIQHVWEKACLCQELDEILIACDHEDVLNAVRSFNGRAVLTDPDHPSGSDRIAQAVENLPVDIVVNIQGDEPFIDPRTIDALVVVLKDEPNLAMGTVIKAITDPLEMVNPNVVKCVVDQKGYALYFSRAPIPYHRDGLPHGEIAFKHLGLYAYRKDFLMRLKDWPKGVLESIEKLEQLRVLEHGVRIKTTLTRHESLAVDTPEDLEKAQAWFDQLN